MSLRFAVLALLTSSRPMTGYALSQHFSQSVAHVWHAPDSQIYPELSRMEADGLVEAQEVPRGRQGMKREYRITDAGIRAFREWIDQPLEIRRQRDPSRLKAAYFEWASVDAARSQLEQHLKHWAAHLDLLEHTRASIVDHTHTTLMHRLDRFPAEEHDRIVRFKVFAYDGLIAQARNEVSWARQGLELLEA